MKIKKLISTMIILAVTLVAYVAASVICCYMTKPQITTAEFPFAITYEYKGETNTMSGTVKCEFSGSETIHFEHSRYWDHEITYDNPKDPENPHIIEENDQTTLALQPSIEGGYLMGDPLHKDDVPEPYIEYYDYINEITMDSENQDEVLAAIGFKIVDFTYGEPIENSFSFAGIDYEADNQIFFVIIALIFLILCAIIVRKDDKARKYSVLDIVGIVLNSLIGVFAVPFITLVCFLFGLVESNVEFINQLTYNVPSIAIACLALSIVLRRKGFSKTSFGIQFVGPVLFVLVIIVDTIF